MIALGGVQSLCLSDKPDLEKLLVEVAHSASSENRHHLMTGSTLT
jgi:hypothetical protein